MSTRYKRTNWVRRLEDFSSGCSSGFGLGQCLIAGILAIFSGISRLLPVTRWLSVILSPDVPVVSTTGARSLKSPASVWRALVLGLSLLVGSVPAITLATIVEGTIFFDQDKDGFMSVPPDEPVAGEIILLKLTDAPPFIDPAGRVTGQNGHYTFDVSPGEYKLWVNIDPQSPLFEQIPFNSEENAQVITVQDGQNLLIDFPLSGLGNGSDLSVAEQRVNEICSSPTVTLYDWDWLDVTTVGPDDVVKIDSGSTVRISTSIDIQVRAFCNYGTLQLSNDPNMPVNFKITFSELFANLVEGMGMPSQGQIVVEETGNEWQGPEPMPNGSSITLKSNWKKICSDLTKSNQAGEELTQAQQEQLLHCDDNNDDQFDEDRKGLFGMFYNEGKIEAGRGYGEITLDGRWPSTDGGNGGSIEVSVARIIQKGIIRGGDGGDGGEGYSGGKGGDVILLAADFDLTATPQSVTSSGKGGNAIARCGDVPNCNWDGYFSCNCPEGVEPPQAQFGEGGDLWLWAPNVKFQGQANAGKSLYIEPDIMLSGAEMQLNAEEDVVVFGGEGWELNLSNLSDEAIVAGRDIILAVGAGGVIDLRGNSSKVFKAGGKVEIHADTVLLDEGVQLEDLIEAEEIIVGPSKILYHAVLSGYQQVSGQANTTVPINLTVYNGGPEVDTYTLAVSSENGWTINGLPSSISINGLGQSEVTLNVTLPADGNDTITVTATSQADPTVVATSEIKVSVAESVPPPEECAHAQYMVEEKVVRIPFLDIPLLDPLTQTPTGEVAVAHVDLSLIEGADDFKIVSDTLEVTDVVSEASECHATYSYDGVLHIPNVDVQTVIILPPGIVADSVTRTYEAILYQLPLSPDVFHLESYLLK